jgi:predicted alpha-1,2-mannosidase
VGFHRVDLPPELLSAASDPTTHDLIGHQVSPGEELRYGVQPEYRPEAPVADRFAATGVCIDLRFTDGSRLSSLTADGQGIALDPTAVYESKRRLVDQWTWVWVPLDAAVGRTIAAVELAVAVPAMSRSATGVLRGWLDPIEIGAVEHLGPRPTDRVRTRRGTHSSMLYSRGLTVPAVGVPHGLIMATPVTDASSAHWVYLWHQHNDPCNRPGIEAFATSLIPSPWIGERAAFHVMPSPESVPVLDRGQRRLSFDHRHEYDRVHQYRVEFDCGIVAELIPARAAVVMRFELPEGGSLLLDRLGTGEVDLQRTDSGARFTGWVDAELERVPVVPRLFVWGEIRGRVHQTGWLETPDRGQAAWASFGPARAGVEVRIGVSFISVEQARRNLGEDVGEADYADVVEAAQSLWDRALSAIEVSGATAEQEVTLTSALARVLLFPNTMHELVGGSPHYASPFQPAKGNRPDRTGLVVKRGLLSVNNGYWDTYRTAWPLLALIDPQTPDLIDGVVQHFRDSGWTTRWSAPGHVDVMVGTSSDAIMADLALRGIALDHQAAFAAAVRNATVVPPEPAVGRKGLERSIFLGYTPAEIWEGLSWTLEAAVNDHAVGRYARWLADRDDRPAERERYLAFAEWFEGRAAGYAKLFNPDTGFFQGRLADGTWRVPSEEFDPGIWGTDYTETNGWGMAFSVPHDGSGLAALHGGTEALAAKLDEFSATPEPGDETVRGSYPYQIHEISEAKDIRLGQLAVSNQPAHHIPAMWCHAGRPDEAQAVLAECCRRLFSGWQIGQGNPGDEDNGEMSAWWILNAIGLYPLVPGEPGWLIVAPLFERTTLRLAGGGEFVITATRQSPDACYIRSARVSGREWTSVWLPHSELVPGGTLHLDLASEPTHWGRGSAPPSASSGLPRVLADHITQARIEGAQPRAVTDDDSTAGLILGSGAKLLLSLDRTGAPTLATLTVKGPASVDLELTIGEQVARLRADFEDGVQTIPFRIPAAPAPLASSARLRNLGPPVDLRQVELLSRRPWDPALDLPEGTGAWR